MKLFKLLALFLVLFVTACADSGSKSEPSVDKEAKAVTFTGTGRLSIAPVIFAEGLQVRNAVRNECQLLTKLPGFVQTFAQDQYAGIDIAAKRSTGSDYLEVQIVDLPRHKKNAWAGRSGQWVGIKGSLLRKGKKTVSFTASRSSMGGFMGAYKGTCALLGRCTKALGKDIAAWLKKPEDGAELGEM